MKFDSIEKEKLIKKEMTKLNRIFKDVDTNKKNSVQSLIKNAAFMAATLEELQTTINEGGVISEYQNGENQWGTKKSPEVEIYNTMIKNYASIIKQLLDCLPQGSQIKEDDPLLKFIEK